MGTPSLTPPPTKDLAPKPRRINLNLSEKAYKDLQDLAQETNRSMTEIVRLGLGLVKIAVREAAASNRLLVASENGEPIREIVLPS